MGYACPATAAIQLLKTTGAVEKTPLAKKRRKTYGVWGGGKYPLHPCTFNSIARSHVLGDVGVGREGGG